MHTHTHAHTAHTHTGKVTKHTSGIDISNGIVDNTVMYYIDSLPRKQRTRRGSWVLWPSCNMLGHEHRGDGGPDQSSG